jgi:hypothetical protein
MDSKSNTHARNDTNKLNTNQSENLLKERTLHDRQSFMEKKMTESTPFFRTTRV